jgi:hypothetical protein
VAVPRLLGARRPGALLLDVFSFVAACGSRGAPRVLGVARSDVRMLRAAHLTKCGAGLV